MDIGTNGEMVLGSKEFLFAGAGAAGPALEGGVSKFGIRAKPGAVSHLKIENDDLVISTIGDEPALGICGSGIVDLLAEMLLSGWMDKQGSRDRKHKKQAQEIFKKMDRKDPIVSAYEKATGKKYELKNPINLSANKKETLEKQDETRQESSEKTLPNVQNEAKEQENEK